MPQPTLFYADGTPIPQEEIWQAYQSGAVRVQEGDSVLMRDTAGQVKRVDAAEFAQARKQGYSILSGEEVAARDREEQFGSVPQMALAGVEGAARGLTLGGSDVLAGAVLGDEYSTSAAARREVNPNVALASELGGAVAPALASGGTGLLASAARLTPAGMVARGGVLAGEGAAALARGAGVANRVALGAIELGAAGALEGAAYGTGQAASEASLYNTDLTAEKLLTGAWEGAKWGFAGGAALGGAAPLAAAAGKKAVEVVAGRGGATVENLAERVASRATLKSVGMQGADVRQLMKNGGEDRIARITKRLHEENLIDAADDIVTRAEKVAEAADDAGKQIGEIRKRLDAGNVQAPQPNEIMRRVSTEILGDLTQTVAETGMNKRVINAINRDVLKPLQKQIDSGQPLGFEALARIRKRIDDRAFEWGGLKRTEDAKHLSKAARIVEDETEKAIAANAGKDLAEQYLGAKQRYSDLITVASKATERAGMNVGNRFFSLTDNMFSGIGVATGIATGSIGVAALQGIALGFANRVLRERGTVAVAQAARRLADFNSRKAELVKAIAGNAAAPARSAKPRGRFKGTTSAAIGSVASRDFERPGIRGAAPRDGLEVAFNSVADRALKAQQNPAMFAEEVSQNMGALSETEPELANRLLMNAIEDQMFLASKIPAVHTRLGATLTPAADQPALHKHEMERLVRYAEALEDPLSVAEDLAAGDMNLEGIEALKERRPALYEEIRQDVIRETMQRGDDLPFSRRVVLSVAFEFTGDRSMEPAYAQGLQQVYAEQAEQFASPPKPPGGAGSQATEKLATSSMTPSQKMALGA